jgi:hypothetical protein
MAIESTPELILLVFELNPAPPVDLYLNFEVY